MTDIPQNRRATDDPFVRLNGVIMVLEGSHGTLPASTIDLLGREVRAARDQLLDPVKDPLQRRLEWAQLTLVISTKVHEHVREDGTVTRWASIINRVRFDEAIVEMHDVINESLAAKTRENTASTQPSTRQ